MSLLSRQELARENSVRYAKASRPQKSRILDEFVAATGYNRKYALAVLLRPPTPRAGPIRRPRAVQYGPDVVRALSEIWDAADRPCGKLLVAAIPDVLRAMEKYGEISVHPGTRQMLTSISAATVDRLLRKVRRSLQWRGRSTTKPGTLLKQQIAIRTANGWDDARPGYVEVDLVAHCGASGAGQFLYTLVFTDIATQWTDFEAIKTKGQTDVVAAIRRIHRRLPFVLLGIDCDNGSEFINGHLFRYCRDNAIHFTRCRPYRKNDQCHVEQKNWSLIRQHVGYGRYEGERDRERLALAYSWLRPHVNFFSPCMKLVAKERNGARVKKTYDSPRTPYARLVETSVLDQDQANELLEYKNSLNPCQLRRQFIQARERLVRYAKVTFTDEATNAA